MQKLATLYSDFSLNYMANNDYKQVLLQGRCAELFVHSTLCDYHTITKKNFNMQYVSIHWRLAELPADLILAGLQYSVTSAS